jgi:hypothetical protein
MKLKENIKVTPSFPLSLRGKLSIVKVLKDKLTHKFVAHPYFFSGYCLIEHRKVKIDLNVAKKTGQTC